MTNAEPNTALADVLSNAEPLHNYHIIFGPPGTGKTRTLTEIIADFVGEHGPDSVMVTSYTRAAAEELVSRVHNVPSSNVRTLHAFGYAAIGGSKKIAEQNIGSWNKFCASNGKHWYMTEATVSIDVEGEEDAGGSTGGGRDKIGDSIFSQINLMRARMIPVENWSPAEQLMYQWWTQWKHLNNFVDFGDMIEIPLRERIPAPTKAKFFIIDEAQDCTAQQIALIRMWGESMKQVIIALDDDQSLYYFTGGDPEACLDLPIPASNRKVLEQSWRVPRKVHSYAQRWVRTISRREPKNYHPRDFDGEVRYIAPDTTTIKEGSYIKPEILVDDALKRYVPQGKTIMYLATCSYMLNPLKAVLRQNGIPFHNPYRSQRNDWNPLTPQSGVASSRRILSFLRPQFDVYGEHARSWNIEELLEWTEALNVKGVFKHGMKKRAENYMASLNGERELITRELDFNGNENGNDLETWLEEEAINQALDGNLDWFEAHLSASKRDGMAFPLSIARKHGAIMLMERPKIILGTIHSVKGAQADVVYLFPDISYAANQGSNKHTLNERWVMAQNKSKGTLNDAERERVKQEDTIKRTFYVGMTRAKESLVICPPAPGTPKSPSPHVDLIRF